MPEFFQFNPMMANVSKCVEEDDGEDHSIDP
jgi:hypothetical protein